MQTCGICKRPPRVGEGHERIRLTVDDMNGMAYPEKKEPGLYACCGDCYRQYLPVVAARMGKTAETIAHNEQF